MEGSAWDTLNTVVSPGWKSRWLRSPDLGGGGTHRVSCVAKADLGQCVHSHLRRNW